MKKRTLYLSIGSTPTEAIHFMASTYDGKFAIVVSAIYILWGTGASIEITPINWIGIGGAFLLPVLILGTYLSHRIDTHNHDNTAAIYCFISEIITAGIPFYRHLEDIL